MTGALSVTARFTPVAHDQALTTAEDSYLPIALAVDGSGAPIDIWVLAGPAHGDLSGTAPNLTYAPHADYFGADSFTWKAAEGTVESNVAAVSITVTPVNDPPLAQDQSVTVADGTAAVPVSLVATDPETPPAGLTWTILSQPTHGTLDGTAPVLTYSPAPGFVGTDAFTFKVTDGDGADSNVATVTLHVTRWGRSPALPSFPIPGPNGLVAGDLDNDGDLDLVGAGSNVGDGTCRLIVLLRDGDGNYPSTPLEPMGAGQGLCDGNEALALGDIDGDGDLDLVAQGRTAPNGGTPRLLWFRNDGTGNLEPQPDIVTPGLWDGAVALGDFDNDGDLDLAATGNDDSASGNCAPQTCKWTGHRFYVFRNDGSGNYALWQEPWGAGNGFAFGSALALGDIDSDGNLDVIVSGETSAGNRQIDLLRNQGGGLPGSPVDMPVMPSNQGILQGHLRLVDLDLDGDLDLLASGQTNDVGGGVTPNLLARFTNESGSFGPAQILDNLGTAGNWPGLTVGDVDQNGTPDVFMSGNDFQARYYRNEAGTLVLREQPEAHFVGPMVFGDFDGDGDLDVAALPANDGLLVNLLGPANAEPTAPTGLASAAGPGGAHLTWTAATDAETPPAALAYEIRVGTTSGTYDLASGVYGTPLAGSFPLGRIAAGQPGRILDPPQSTYYWQVRAIDSGLLAGPWSAEEGTFVPPVKLSMSGDVTVTEPDSGGTALATFTVSISGPPTQDVTVQFATQDGSAVGGSDYQAGTGMVTFPASSADPQTFSITVDGDDLAEAATEDFFVHLQNPSANAILTGDTTARVTIAENEPASLSVHDASFGEGQSGSQNVHVAVRLSRPAVATVTVGWSTASGTALAGSDYQSASGTLTFSPGTITQTAEVRIYGDTVLEGVETFFVNLSNPSGAPLADDRATVTILDDDGAPPTPTSLTWTVAREGHPNLNGVASNGSVYVMVADYGEIYTSSDAGESWTKHVVDTARRQVSAVTWANGQFVAVGNWCCGGTGSAAVVFTSPDGTTWTARDSAPAGNNVRLRSVAYGDGRYVAVGESGEVLWSADGVSWTAGSSGTTEGLKGVAFGGGVFVAVGWNRTVLRSTDGGASWSPATAASDDPGARIQGVTHTGTGFVAVGGEPETWTRLAMTSPDGETWTRQQISGGGWWTLSGVIAGNGKVRAFVPGFVYTSLDDGVTWTDAPLPSGGPGANNSLSAGAYGPGGFVACGTEGALYTAPPGGSPWTARTLDASRFYWSLAEGNGMLCAVSGYSTARSADGGLTWTNHDISPFQPLGGVEKVAFGNGVFVGAAMGIAIHSTTCTDDWQGGNGILQSIPELSGCGFNDVAYGASQFVAVGQGALEVGNDVLDAQAVLFTSTDGVNWTRRDPGLPAFYSIGSVAYGSGRWVATAQSWDGTARALLTSEDGVHWTTRPWPFSGRDGSGVDFVQDRFFAGNWTSADGLAWTQNGDGPGAMAYGAGRYVGGGTSGQMQISTDAVHWASGPTGTGHNLDSAAYLAGPNRFVAVGNSAIVYSGASPTVSVGNAGVTEGDIDEADMIFTVTRFDGDGQPVTVDFATADGTATAGSDYTARPTTTLTFAGGTGASSQDVVVRVHGDTVPEPDETFQLNLSNPIGAVIDVGSGTGTIVNDEGGWISGIVRHDGSPLGGVEVGFFDASGTQVGTALTGPSGIYTSPLLVPGDYYARVDLSPYACQYHDHVSCNGGTPVAAGAAAIQVTESATTPNVDFDLVHTGTIAGTVTDEQSGTPLSVTVWIWDARGTIVYWNTSSASGTYSATLPPGQYRVVAGNGDPDHVPEVYDNLQWIGWPWGLTGTAVNVTADSTSTVNFQLARVGRIHGTVTDAAGGLPLEGQDVCIWHSWAFTCGTTDANGVYTITGLPAGEYPVFANGTSGYGILYYDGSAGVPAYSGSAPQGATKVTVTAGATVDGIDFALHGGARIEGTVTDQATTNPLPSVTVNVYSEFGQQLIGGKTDATGHYVLGGLGAGTFYVRTDNSDGYANQCFGGTVCPVLQAADVYESMGSPDFIAGTPIVLAADATAQGIDFALAKGGRISGRLTNAQGQGIGGSLIVFDAARRKVAGVNTDSSGNYVTPQGLPAGSYYVFASGGSYVAEVYDNHTCLGCNPNTGNAVEVALGATTSGIDFALEQGGQIAGRVYDATSQQGFPAAVEVWSAAGVRINPDNEAVGDFAGGYVTGGLPAGTYYLRTRNWSGYVDEAYDNVVCTQACIPLGTTPVQVTAGTVIWGNDFGLSRGALITGTVTNSAAEPMGGTQGQIFDAAGKLVTHWSTNPQGRYVPFHSLPAGTYYVRTRNVSSYLDEVYNGQPCIGSCNVGAGTGIEVTDADVGNVNFTLWPALAVSDATMPESVGTATFNVTLSHALSQPVTIHYATSDQTATAGSDYTATAATLTFEPGQTTKAILVPIGDDGIDESSETFLLTLSSPTLAVIVDSTGVGTIADDDLAPTGLAVTKAGPGAGTVTSSPAGIDCGTTCESSFDEGTVVTLTATAEPGSYFSGWSGACNGTQPTCQLTMNAARRVTATFGTGAGPLHFYVDIATGSDSTGPGSQASPWQTVAHALSQVTRQQQCARRDLRGAGLIHGLRHHEALRQPLWR